MKITDVDLFETFETLSSPDMANLMEFLGAANKSPEQVSRMAEAIRHSIDQKTQRRQGDLN